MSVGARVSSFVLIKMSICVVLMGVFGVDGDTHCCCSVDLEFTLEHPQPSHGLKTSFLSSSSCPNEALSG